MVFPSGEMSRFICVPVVVSNEMVRVGVMHNESHFLVGSCDRAEWPTTGARNSASARQRLRKRAMARASGEPWVRYVDGVTNRLRHAERSEASGCGDAIPRFARDDFISSTEIARSG